MSVSGGRPLPIALAGVEHRRLVLLALADDDDAVHVDGVQREAHRVDGGLVGRDLVALAHPARGGQGGGLGDAGQLKGEVSVEVACGVAWATLFSEHRALPPGVMGLLVRQWLAESGGSARKPMRCLTIRR